MAIKGESAHVPSSSEQRPRASSCTMQSCMRPFQLSPVIDRKRRRKERQKLVKLASSLRKPPGCWAMAWKRFMPSTA